MRNGLIVLLIAFILHFNCKSQISNSNVRITETKMRFVFGSSKQFPSLDLGISFQENITLNDTVFYINFILTTSTSEYNSGIYIGKNNNLTFLSKSGKSVILSVNEDIKIDEIEVHKDELIMIPRYYYKSTFKLKVTKEQLLIIGSEPFYSLILTYNDVKTKKVRFGAFNSPNFYTKRSFTQKDIKFLLQI